MSNLKKKKGLRGIGFIHLLQNCVMGKSGFREVLKGQIIDHSGSNYDNVQGG